MTGELTSNVAPVVASFVSSKYATYGTLHVRTSPPNKKNWESPYCYVREIQELHKIRNVHGNRFRNTATIWLHVGSSTKDATQTVLANLKIIWKANYKAPGSNMKYILLEGETPNNDIESKPRRFETIVKWTVVWDETT